MRTSFNKLLLALAFAFFVWDALTYVHVPGGHWLLPGGLAAWALAVLLPLVFP